MPRGKFRHPIHMNLSQLEVPYRNTWFIVTINAHDRFGIAGVIPITYFGYIEDGIFYVVSYSFSVQHLRQEQREAYSFDPRHTAKMGLSVVGVPAGRG